MYEILRVWTGSFIRANSGTNSLAGPSNPHHLHISHYPSAQMDEFPHSLAFSTVLLGGGRIISKTLNHIQGGSWSPSPQKPILFLSNYNQRKTVSLPSVTLLAFCVQKRERREGGGAPCLQQHLLEFDPYSWEWNPLKMKIPHKHS
jgi:hypothetical protein